MTEPMRSPQSRSQGPRPVRLPPGQPRFYTAAPKEAHVRSETMRTRLNNWKRARIYAAIGVVGLGVLACVTPPLETPKTVNTGITRIYVPQNLKNKVDILFLIDNSNSMEAMQTELKNRFQQF